MGNIEGDRNEARVSGGLAKQVALLDPDHLLRTAPQPFEVVVRAHLQREEVYQHPAAAVDQDPAVVAVAFGARAPAIDAHREVDGVHDRPPLANVVDGRHDEVIGERGEARQVEQHHILGLAVDEDIDQRPGALQGALKVDRAGLWRVREGEVVEVGRVVSVGRGDTGLQAAPPAAGAYWRPCFKYTGRAQAATRAPARGASYTGDMSARVLVAMSGGVDSAVAAALLHEQGYDVVGVTLRLYTEADDTALRSGRTCCGIEDVGDARAAAQRIGIPHYTLNMEREFERDVVEPFVDAYRNGRTPNPCLNCNQYVKFDTLLNRALAMGVDYLATGHYARVERDGDTVRLHRARKHLRELLARNCKACAKHGCLDCTCGENNAPGD